MSELLGYTRILEKGTPVRYLRFVRYTWLILFFGFHCSFFVFGLTWAPASTNIPSDRLVDWSVAGVWYNGVQGVPTSYTLGVDATASPYNCDKTGVNDITSGLQAAINACAANHYVYLPAGTYKLLGQVTIGKSNIEIRGAGPGQTIIMYYGSGQYTPAIYFVGTNTNFYADCENGTNTGNDVWNMASGYTKGSNTIVVSSGGSNFKAGDIVFLDELNDPSVAINTDPSGNIQTYQGLAPDGSRAVVEQGIVKSVSGNTITLVDPMDFTYQSSLAPRAIIMTHGAVTCSGISNLTMNGANQTDGYAILFQYCAHCWGHHVEITNFARKGFMLTYGTCHCEIRRNYIHDSKAANSDIGYGIGMQPAGNRNLVIDNIGNNVHVLCDQETSSGNVIAYNCCPNTRLYDPTWLIPAYGSHGCFSHMNLFEGNVGNMILLDNTHGSGAWMMCFRNWLKGQNDTSPICTYDLACYIDMQWNYYESVVGCVMGHKGMAGGVQGGSGYSSENDPFIYLIGYAGGPATAPTDSNCGATMLRHGNYLGVTDSIEWVSGWDHALPTSLFLSSKPSFYGSLAWPSIDPASPSSPFNPASVRWSNYQASGNLSYAFADQQ